VLLRILVHQIVARRARPFSHFRVFRNEVSSPAGWLGGTLHIAVAGAIVQLELVVPTGGARSLHPIAVFADEFSSEAPGLAIARHLSVVRVGHVVVSRASSTLPLGDQVVKSARLDHRFALAAEGLVFALELTVLCLVLVRVVRAH